METVWRLEYCLLGKWHKLPLYQFSRRTLVELAANVLTGSCRVRFFDATIRKLYGPECTMMELYRNMDELD